MDEHHHRPVVFLEGDLVYLRPVEPADLAAAQRWVNDPATRRFLSLYLPLSQMQEQRFLEQMNHSPTDIVLAIVEKGRDRHVGMIGLHQIHWANRNALFGINVGEPSARRKGFGGEATRLILGYAFQTLNLHRVGLEVFDFNTAAIALYEKLGFVREGTLREQHFADGAYHSEYRYGLLAREFSR